MLSLLLRDPNALQTEVTVESHYPSRRSAQIRRNIEVNRDFPAISIYPESHLVIPDLDYFKLNEGIRHLTEEACPAIMLPRLLSVIVVILLHKRTVIYLTLAMSDQETIIRSFEPRSPFLESQTLHCSHRKPKEEEARRSSSSNIFLNIT